jgi:hypothetical protein
MAPGPNPQPNPAKPGGNPSMPKATKADAVSAVVEQWSKTAEATPGYRSGQAASPGKAQDTLEVSSFLQVPAILKAIENGESLRLKFPEPAPGTPNADKIRAEQAEIRQFLKDKGSKSFSEIQRELAGLIQGCVEFSKVSNDQFTGKDWIEAHKLSAKSDSLTLNVTSVYKGDAAVAGGQVELEALMVKLEQHIDQKKSPKAILTIDPANAEALASSISEHLAVRGGKAKGLANVTVWVGASKDTVSGGKVTDAECSALSAMPLDEFLKRYGKGKQANSANQPSGSTPNPIAQPAVKPAPVELLELRYKAVAV